MHKLLYSSSGEGGLGTLFLFLDEGFAPGCLMRAQVQLLAGVTVDEDLGLLLSCGGSARPPRL